MRIIQKPAVVESILEKHGPVLMEGGGAALEGWVGLLSLYSVPRSLQARLMTRHTELLLTTPSHEAHAVLALFQSLGIQVGYRDRVTCVVPRVVTFLAWLFDQPPVLSAATKPQPIHTSLWYQLLDCLPQPLGQPKPRAHGAMDLSKAWLKAAADDLSNTLSAVVQLGFPMPGTATLQLQAQLQQVATLSTSRRKQTVAEAATQQLKHVARTDRWWGDNKLDVLRALVMLLLQDEVIRNKVFRDYPALLTLSVEAQVLPALETIRQVRTGVCKEGVGQDRREWRTAGEPWDHPTGESTGRRVLTTTWRVRVGEGPV
jgi:hypothetical protein